MTTHYVTKSQETCELPTIDSEFHYCRLICFQVDASKKNHIVIALLFYLHKSNQCKDKDLVFEINFGLICFLYKQT